MKTHKLALLIILSLIVFQVDAQISSVVDTQIELDSDSRAVITSVNKHKFSFKKPVLDLVLPVKNISVSVAEDAATPKSVALSVRGLSSDGKILFPLFISHGMRIEPHENGTFEIPLSLCTGSIFVFSGEVSSVELEVNGNQGQNIYMEFDEITSFQLSEIRRANHASCEFNHLALLVDDSKSNAKELSNILSRIDSILLSQNKIKKVSLISLNTRGRFVTFDIEESTLRRNLASFNSFEKSKYTNWNEGFSNIDLVDAIAPINYLSIIADGFTNSNGTHVSVIESLSDINGKLSSYSDISKVDLTFLTNEDKLIIEQFIKKAIPSVDNVFCMNQGDNFNIELTNLNRDCIEEDSDTSIKISPNPTTDIINISGLENYESIEVNIYDLDGSLVYTKNVKPKSKEQVSLQYFVSGIYFIEIISNGNKIKSQRIVKIN